MTIGKKLYLPLALLARLTETARAGGQLDRPRE